MGRVNKKEVRVAIDKTNSSVSINMFNDLHQYIQKTILENKESPDGHAVALANQLKKVITSIPQAYYSTKPENYINDMHKMIRCEKILYELYNRSLVQYKIQQGNPEARLIEAPSYHAMKINTCKKYLKEQGIDENEMLEPVIEVYKSEEFKKALQEAVEKREAKKKAEALKKELQEAVEKREAKKKAEALKKELQEAVEKREAKKKAEALKKELQELENAIEAKKLNDEIKAKEIIAGWKKITTDAKILIDEKILALKKLQKDALDTCTQNVKDAKALFAEMQTYRDPDNDNLKGLLNKVRADANVMLKGAEKNLKHLRLFRAELTLLRQEAEAAKKAAEEAAKKAAEEAAKKAAEEAAKKAAKEAEEAAEIAKKAKEIAEAKKAAKEAEAAAEAAKKAKEIAEAKKAAKEAEAAAEAAKKAADDIIAQAKKMIEDMKGAFSNHKIEQVIADVTLAEKNIMQFIDDITNDKNLSDIAKTQKSNELLQKLDETTILTKQVEALCSKKLQEQCNMLSNCTNGATALLKTIKASKAHITDKQLKEIKSYIDLFEQSIETTEGNIKNGKTLVLDKALIQTAAQCIKDSKAISDYCEGVVKDQEVEMKAEEEMNAKLQHIYSQLNSTAVNKKNKEKLCQSIDKDFDKNNNHDSYEINHFLGNQIYSLMSTQKNNKSLVDSITKLSSSVKDKEVVLSTEIEYIKSKLSSKELENKKILTKDNGWIGTIKKAWWGNNTIKYDAKEFFQGEMENLETVLYKENVSDSTIRHGHELINEMYTVMYNIDETTVYLIGNHL